MSVVFGASLHFDIIGEIPAWPHKSGNYGKKPTHIQNWTRDFVKLIVDNHCMFSSVQFIFAISIVFIDIYINIQIMKFEIKWRGSS